LIFTWAEALIGKDKNKLNKMNAGNFMALAQAAAGGVVPAFRTKYR
jgi:hypothetical protein